MHHHYDPNILISDFTVYSLPVTNYSCLDSDCVIEYEIILHKVNFKQYINP